MGGTRGSQSLRVECCNTLSTNSVDPWSIVFLADLIISQVVKLPALMEPEGSLPFSQEPATGPYPKTDVSTKLSHPTSLRSILILSSRLHLSLPSDLFSLFSNQNFVCISRRRHVSCFLKIPSKSIYKFQNKCLRIIIKIFCIGKQQMLPKVKVKLSLCLTKHHAMKAYWGSGCIAPRILNLGIELR
jgi:hypothetical protein